MIRHHVFHTYFHFGRDKFSISFFRSFQKTKYWKKSLNHNKMADEFDENDFEEDFQEADEPEDLNDDLDAGEGEQEQIDILPAGKHS